MPTKATKAPRPNPADIALPRRKPRTPPQSGVLPTHTTDPTEFWPWPLRPYQQNAFEHFQAGQRRQLLIWHRRAGKDMFGLSLARHEMQRRVGSYWHMFPKFSQAKRALWEGVDPRQGRRFVDIAFGDIAARVNNSDMMIEANNGSTWTLLGSDTYDRIVGSNAVGIVFSEWALCNPKAWEYIRPIIRENNGWACFITTFRGRNHAYRMFQRLKDNPQWFCEIRTVDDTTDVAGNRIITPEDIAQERLEGMSEALVRQEYFCSPDAGVTGSVYARQVMRLADDPSRMAALWNPRDQVVCAWNLEHFPASVSLVVCQPGSGQRRPSVLAAETLDFTTIPECVAWLKTHPFPIHAHLVPADQSEYLELLTDLKIYPTLLDVSAAPIESLTQTMLEELAIDAVGCPELVESLLGYVRVEGESAVDGATVFGDTYAYSWHAYQVNALELFAGWTYYAGSSWSKDPDYSPYDRRRI